jgi:molecular chaperone GrpE
MENKTQQTEKEMNKTAEATSENGGKDMATDTVSEKPGAEDNGKEAEVIKLKSEITESKDKYIRLYSEFENFRRRTAKEKIELTLNANEQLIKALLPVTDDFERAEKSFKDKNDKDSEGFFLIQNKFRKVLEQYGVKAMDLKKGSDFNADLHEAITQIPAAEENLKGKVVDVVEKGYLLNDKVIRHAKVVVGN